MKPQARQAIRAHQEAISALLTCDQLPDDLNLANHAIELSRAAFELQARSSGIALWPAHDEPGGTQDIVAALREREVEHLLSLHGQQVGIISTFEGMLVSAEALLDLEAQAQPR